MDENRNHMGRTPEEQRAFEKRCEAFERMENHRRAIVERDRAAAESARMWGEW